MKACERSRRVAPLILKVGTTSTCALNFMSHIASLQEKQGLNTANLLFSFRRYFATILLYVEAVIAQLVWLLATGWTVRGSRSRWGRDFPQSSRLALSSPSLLYNRYRIFPGGKAAEAWRWPPALCSAKVKERVELYFYSPLWLRALFYGVLYFYLYLLYVFCKEPFFSWNLYQDKY
jgi:hypothetical protein